MLGTFPTAFSQVATSQGDFPKWQLPKCSISQAATSQVSPSLSGRPLSCYGLSARPSRPILAAVLGLFCSLQRLIWPNQTFGKSALRKLPIWEVGNWEIVTWEVALVKMPLGKYLTPSNGRAINWNYILPL